VQEKKAKLERGSTLHQPSTGSLIKPNIHRRGLYRDHRPTQTSLTFLVKRPLAFKMARKSASQ